MAHIVGDKRPAVEQQEAAAVFPIFTVDQRRRAVDGRLVGESSREALGADGARLADD